MKVLGLSGEEQRALWLILGAIYHLGAAGATKGRKSQLTRLFLFLEKIGTMQWDQQYLEKIYICVFVHGCYRAVVLKL